MILLYMASILFILTTAPLKPHHKEALKNRELTITKTDLNSAFLVAQKTKI